MAPRAGLWLAVGTAVLAACAPGPGSSPGSSPTADAARDTATVVDPDELVALAGGAGTADRLVRFADRRGYRVERRDPLPGLGLELITLRLPPGTDPVAAIAALEGREPATTVGRNHAYRDAPVPAQPAGPRTYAGALLGWPAAGCPARQPVGIIDTALDPAAPALAGATIASRDFTVGGAAGGTAHATAVAELVAGPGRLAGARLYHAAVVGDVPAADPAAGVDDIVRAIDWLAGEGVRLVNVSLAGPYNKILDRGLAAAADRGMLVVAAAGNDGGAAPPRYPAAFDFAVAVTAVDAGLAPYARAPRGEHIDVAAPGVDVYVPGEGYLTGTSIAAPFVTAAIAADPAAVGLDPTEVRRQLVAAARDLGPPGRDATFGAGLAIARPPCGTDAGPR
ncbi:MAG TPA: S8 family serine peptidase [Amaricoccus sp.]|nr:S8 family serine peptidase [Amaricoccus sp.]